MKFSDTLTVASNFKRSTNILYDTNCESYILSTSSIEALRRIFVNNSSNSVAITGPFGSGKSSLLIFLEALLIKEEEHDVCIEKLREKEPELFNYYEQFVGSQSKGFISIKLVGEHLSFRQILISALKAQKELKLTHAFIENNEELSLVALLETLDEEMTALGFTGVVFFIDELGKIIEYASEKYLDSDIHALQDLAEFVNKQDHYRLVVALHKSFKDYVQNVSNISFTEWDKIQGRFENIVFQDDFYELMHIFEEAITVNDQAAIKNTQTQVVEIYNKYTNYQTNKSIPVSSDSLQKLAPLHPFASLALFHIFSKHFQNQRSIFSFLSAQEPYSFQHFISNEQEKNALFSLPMLFDYINYLLNAYRVNMVDQESWNLANDYLDSANILTDTEQYIIKSIALISAFNLEHLIQLDEYGLELALSGVSDVKSSIKDLTNKGLLLFKVATKSYALIEETSIDINAELLALTKGQTQTDFEKEINELIDKDRLLAKRFFIDTGTAKFFTKEYLESDLSKSYVLSQKLIYISAEIPEEQILKVSKQNQECIYVSLPLTQQLRAIVQQSIAIETLLQRTEIHTNQLVRKILNNMLHTNKLEIDKILDTKESLYFSGESLSFSSVRLQQKMSQILANMYPNMPIILNDLVNTVNREISVPLGAKMLFKHMIEKAYISDLGIEKTPPHKAIYLSVIKKAGFHRQNDPSQAWRLSAPTECNFAPAWERLSKEIKKDSVISVTHLIDLLTHKPFGLNEDAAKFVVFVYMIINESHIHFFRENTYQFDFDVDQVMDIWKNTKLYTIRWYDLTENEKTIFEKYIQIFDQYFDTNYSKKNIKLVFQKLSSKMKALPKYCQQTQGLSKEAKQLRSKIISSKAPHASFYEEFPKAVGFETLTSENVDDFIKVFKEAFNEIVFSYKRMILELEQTVANAFNLSNKHYPFGNEFESILDNYLKINDKDQEANGLYRMATTANDLVSFINGISLVLSHKKVDDAFDKDIEEFKVLIKNYSQHLLSKFEIADLIKERPVDVKKLKISTIHGESDIVVSVNNTKAMELSSIADKLLYNLPQNITKDERLYLIALLAENTSKDQDE